MASYLTEIQTFEFGAALAALGYFIYKYESSPSIGESISSTIQNINHNSDVAANREILNSGPPGSDWSQGKRQDYTSACRFVIANPSDYSPAEMAKAQYWITYINQNPSEQNTQQYNTAVANGIRIIEGPYPVSDDPNEPYRKTFTWTALGILHNPDDYPDQDKARANAWIRWINYPLTPRPTNSGAPATAEESANYDWRAQHLSAEPNDDSRLQVVLWVRAHPGSVSQAALDAANTWFNAYSVAQASSSHRPDPHSGY
jgi:hypothetical protein